MAMNREEEHPEIPKSNSMGNAKPVFTTHNKKVKHVVNLFSLVLDNWDYGLIRHNHVLRPCESAECFRTNNMEVPYTKHLMIRTPSMIWYACLECGRQMHIEGTVELDEIEELPYEYQKTLALDNIKSRRKLNTYLKDVQESRREHCKKQKQKQRSDTTDD